LAALGGEGGCGGQNPVFLADGQKSTGRMGTNYCPVQVATEGKPAFQLCDANL
jgi:hypothetical protein